MSEKTFYGDEHRILADAFIFDRMQFGQVWRVSEETLTSTTVLRCRKVEREDVDEIIYEELP